MRTYFHSGGGHTGATWILSGGDAPLSGVQSYSDRALVSLSCQGNRNPFSNSSGGQGSKTKGSDGLVPWGDSETESVPCLS